MTDHVGHQFTHHRHEVRDEVTGEIVDRPPEADVALQIVALGDLADHVGELAADGRGLRAVLLVQLEDGRPDLGHRRVQVVDAAGEPFGRLRVLRLEGAAEAVQRQCRGEDPLDDVVVQVAGDPVPVGLHLEPPLALLGAGQLQDDRRAGGERREQLQVVGVERTEPRGSGA